MAKRSLVSRIAAKSFKPVDGGYLLVTSDPWLIGTGPAYIVTEAQKEALVAVMPPRRPLLVFVVVLAWYEVAFGLGSWVALNDLVPKELFWLGNTAVGSAGIYAFLVVMIRRKLRRMAPILANAKPMLTASGKVQQAGS